MFHEVPVKSNSYNFSQTVSLGGVFFSLRFTYLNRRQTYVLDILDSSGELLEAGIACVTNVQLNRRILTYMPGVLFFQSVDKTISEVDRTSLGTKVKLFYYIDVQ